MSSSFPSQQDMNPADKEKRKAELAILNILADMALGRRIPDGRPWHTEKKLSKETIQALDSLESKEKSSESTLHKEESPEMKARQDNFDRIVKNRLSPRYQHGPVSQEERLRAWHRALGSPQYVVETEIAQLKQRG